MQRTRPWRTFSHFTDVGGGVLSAGMSYQALFAVFAGIWVGFGIFSIQLVSRPELLQSLIEQINVFIPGLIGENGVVDAEVLLRTGHAVNWVSVLAGASLLWVMINWFTGTRRAIRIIFGLDVKQYRSALLLKLRDLALALLFGVAILVSAALTLISSNLTEAVFSWLHWDPHYWLLSTVGGLIRYGAVFVFDLLVLMAIHRFLAEVRVPLWRLMRGCALGALALLALKVLGTAVIGGTTSNPLLATFAVFVGILIWFNFICRVLLLTASWIATGGEKTLGLPAT